MKFNMPMAVFGGLALIAAAIYFGSGSAQVNAANSGVQKVAFCDSTGTWCADILQDKIGCANAKDRKNCGTLSIAISPR